MKEFFEALNSVGKPKRNDIIEKDFHLHRLLYQISNDEYFKENLLFKGGTCLIKAYLDYYRFSEDIDFTWINKKSLEGRSISETKRLCSAEITILCERLKEVSDKLDLRFSGDKRNQDDVHISSGGRMVTFYIGYDSEILNIPAQIKVEMNFFDIVLFPHKKIELKGYVEGLGSDEIRFLYEDLWNEYNRRIAFKCYDPREIFVEKCRAALTRIKYKFRDALDIYYLENKFGFTISDLKKEIIEKTKFAIELYIRYEERIEIAPLPPADVLKSEELNLLLVEPPDNFQNEIERIYAELNQIRKELL
jgi:predicted nucleotidyltransferase component of viral defense system